MSRKPDYEQMKQMVAQREAENLSTSQIEDILYYGLNGYKYDSNEDIMETFMQIYDAKDIPKVKIDRGDDNPLWPHYIKEDD